MAQKIHLIYQNLGFEKWHMEWLLALLKGFDVECILDPDRSVRLDRAIVVPAPGGPDSEARIGAHLRSFRERGLRVGLAHVTDECFDEPIGYYEHVDFVFRNHYRQSGQKPGHGFYYPLGSPVGLKENLVSKPINQRKYTWSFAGQIKTSRQAMLKSAERIKGGYAHLTHDWDDPRGLSRKDYAALLSDTVFVLCPRGNCSVECFRLYEALDAGAIPIVEDEGGLAMCKEFLDPRNFMRIGLWRRSYWQYHFRNPLKRQSYWEAAFGEFPVPRLMHWETLETLLQRIDIDRVSARIREWWGQHQAFLRSQMATVIERAFFDVKEPAMAG